MYVTVSFLSKLFLLPAKNRIASISVESSRLSASSPRITKIFGIYRYLETQSSPSEELVTDERLCQLLADIENSQRSTGEICATHVDRLCKEGLHSTAARLLCKLPDKGIPPSLKAYNILLSASGRENNVEVSSWVFKEIVVSYDTVPTAAYLSFAKAFINTNDHTHLLRVVKEVSELIPGPRRTVLINRLTFAFSECKQFDKALLIFDELKNLNCIPDLITYNTVLDVFGCAGQVDEMLLLFVSMKENGITPDLIAYNTLLNHMRKAGRLDLCLTYFKEMIERGIEPDLLTYTALIGSLGKSGKIEELLCAFDEMEAKMIRPSIYVYRATVNRLKKMGKVELAAAFSEKMNASLPNLAGPNDFKRKGRK